MQAARQGVPVMGRPARFLAAVVSAVLGLRPLVWLARVGLGAITVLAVGSASQGSITFENPVGAATGEASAIMIGQFLGARFQFTEPVEVESVGGVFQNIGGTYFAALVPLASMAALPTGDPANGIPFNPGEVLAYRTFAGTVGGTPALQTVPFSIALDPGVYGVVFGTGLYGTSPSGNPAMPRYEDVPGSNSFFWSSSPWRWQSTGSWFPEENRIQITIVPEPATLALVALGGLALLRHRKKVRDGAGAVSVPR